MTRASFCAKTCRRLSSTTTLGNSVEHGPFALPLDPSVICPPLGIVPSPLFLPTLSRRLRSGLRGPAVEDRVVLKGTLKRMPLDANCAVREQLALSAANREERPRDDSSRAAICRNCCYVARDTIVRF